jgi:protease IV
MTQPDPADTADNALPADTPATAPTAAPRPAQPPAAPSAAERLLDQFALEYVRERRAARRWRLIFRAGWLVLAALLVWGYLSENMHGSAPSTPHTALVELSGEIAPGTEASAEFMLSGLRSAFEDEGALAVVLRVNSPGGSPVQSGIIHDEILRLKKKHDKKVYVVVEESCASGAYYIAVAADAIYVDKASLVGSIGVLMDGFGFNGVMEKYGVERRLITAGENKALLDPFSPLSPRHRAYAQAMLDQIHQQFIAVVRQGRGDRLKETPDTFSGLFWNGEEAVRLGLADAFGNLDYVAREVVGAEDIIDYTPKENVAERLAKRFGAALGAGAVQALRHLPAVQ